MPTYVVYVDQVFLGSLIMNVMILWVTAKLGRVNFIRWRLLASAAIGAMYSLFVFIPVLENFLNPGYKFGMSVLMIIIVFIPSPIKKVIMLLAYFYLSTFALGGTVLGIVNFLHSSSFSDGSMTSIMQAVDAYLWYGVILGLAIFWSLGRIAPAVLRKRLILPLLRADLSVNLRGQKVCLAAMLDTGNNLTDPLTGHPVIVAEYEAIKKILPEQVRSVVEQHKQDDSAVILAELGENIRQGNFRIIPYRSVGRENGWLLAFRPDEVELRHGGNMFRTNDVIVALYSDYLRSDTPCRALLPPGLLESRIAG